MSEAKPKAARVLVVDDRPNMLRLVQKILKGDAELVTAGDGAAAIALLERETVDVVLCDLKMREVDGLAVLEACKRIQPRAVFVLMTAYATVTTAIQAMRMGAYDYLSKPFEPEDLRAVVLRALGRAASLGPADRAKAGAPAGESGALLPGVHGRSAVMLELTNLVRRIAPSATTTLLLGDTGTGKEGLARALHALSPRAEARFVAINCAAIPGELLESELFGHARGAFSGANQDRRGLFEDASGGTLFLDEIGDMQASLQAKLTRVLEARSIRRLGETRERSIDVRLVAATHRDIEAMVAAGTFREDLWYRLNVAVLRLPPLRERRQDIELLARRFLVAEADKRPAAPRDFSPAALELLRASTWPGNVRQLKAAVERAALLAAGPSIEVGDLPPDLRRPGAKTGDTQDTRAAKLLELSWQQVTERARDRVAPHYLEVLLEAERGNVSAAAARAGIERESFYRLMRKYGVRAEDFR